VQDPHARLAEFSLLGKQVGLQQSEGGDDPWPEFSLLGKQVGLQQKKIVFCRAFLIQFTRKTGRSATYRG